MTKTGKLQILLLYFRPKKIRLALAEAKIDGRCSYSDSCFCQLSSRHLSVITTSKTFKFYNPWMERGTSAILGYDSSISKDLRRWSTKSCHVDHLRRSCSLLTPSLSPRLRSAPSWCYRFKTSSTLRQRYNRHSAVMQAATCANHTLFVLFDLSITHTGLLFQIYRKIYHRIGGKFGDGW